MDSSLSILTVAEMYAADRAAEVAGISSLALMEAAGAAVAREVEKRWPKGPVVVACGPGNNGGDGFVVARLLAAKGWPVRVGVLGTPKGDAAVMAERCPVALAPLDLALLNDQPRVVDALFGAGLSRPLDGLAATFISAINSNKIQCIAVDIPSGTLGDSGEHGTAPQCVATVTFFRPKPAHFLQSASALCGDVVVADIGIPAAVLDQIQPKQFVNAPGLWQYPRPGVRAHKYTRGHVVVFGGAKTTGAARLTARGARRIGAGLLTLAVPSSAAVIYAADPGAMVEACDSTDDFDASLKDPRRNVAVIGPGFGVGPLTADRVLRLLETDKAVVLDADALTSFASKPNVLIAACRARKAATVFTPHEGEFARLFEIKGSKLVRARAAAAKANAIVILKGPDTVIAAPDGLTAISKTAGPWLATGGSGDVLAGFVAGLLAQGMPAFAAAAAAVWIHGACGDRFGPGLIAEDIPEAAPGVIKDLLGA